MDSHIMCCRTARGKSYSALSVASMSINFIATRRCLKGMSARKICKSCCKCTSVYANWRSSPSRFNSIDKPSKS